MKNICVIWGQGNPLVKNRPVKFRPDIFGMLPYANEIRLHIYQIFKNITGQ